MKCDNNNFTEGGIAMNGKIKSVTVIAILMMSAVAYSYEDRFNQFKVKFPKKWKVETQQTKYAATHAANPQTGSGLKIFRSENTISTYNMNQAYVDKLAFQKTIQIAQGMCGNSYESKVIQKEITKIAKYDSITITATCGPNLLRFITIPYKDYQYNIIYGGNKEELKTAMNCLSSLVIY